MEGRWGGGGGGGGHGGELGGSKGGFLPTVRRLLVTSRISFLTGKNLYLSPDSTCCRGTEDADSIRLLSSCPHQDRKNTQHLLLILVLSGDSELYNCQIITV